MKQNMYVLLHLSCLNDAAEKGVTCQQRDIILLQSSVCYASPTKPWHRPTSHQCCYKYHRKVFKYLTTLPVTSLHDVFHATAVAKVTYGALAWSGMCSAADRSKLNSFINRCRKFGYCDKELPSVTELFTEADDKLFSTTLNNEHHVLLTYLPDRTETTYNLRNRTHNK